MYLAFARFAAMKIILPLRGKNVRAFLCREGNFIRNHTNVPNLLVNQLSKLNYALPMLLKDFFQEEGFILLQVFLSALI